MSHPRQPPTLAHRILGSRRAPQSWVLVCAPLLGVLLGNGCSSWGVVGSYLRYHRYEAQPVRLVPYRRYTDQEMAHLTDRLYSYKLVCDETVWDDSGPDDGKSSAAYCRIGSLWLHAGMPSCGGVYWRIPGLNNVHCGGTCGDPAETLLVARDDAARTYYFWCIRGEAYDDWVENGKYRPPLRAEDSYFAVQVGVVGAGR